MQKYRKCPVLHTRTLTRIHTLKHRTHTALIERPFAGRELPRELVKISNIYLKQNIALIFQLVEKKQNEHVIPMTIIYIV